jgi:ElaB/YqjD/DUF883 family membrane-anchored ribosome-binding protein
MTNVVPVAGVLSLYTIGADLIRRRRRILLLMVLGGAIAVATVLTAPNVYVAGASFAPQSSSDAGRSGLASLAGQLGVSVPSSNQAQSPDFFARLVTSRAVLAPIRLDTFTVEEEGGRRATFDQLFKIEGSPAIREQNGITILKGIVSPSVVKVTGVVEVVVTTRWRSVSLAIAHDVVDGVNAFNERTRQGQASSERKFVEGRLAVAGTELRAAEDRLEQFLQTNRQFSAPQLSTARDRLERDVMARQQVFTSLTQSYDDARIREARDTPVITIIDAPWASTTPLARGVAFRTIVGMLLGVVVGVISIVIPAWAASLRSRRTSDTRAFLDSLDEARSWRSRRGSRVNAGVATP